MEKPQLAGFKKPSPSIEGKEYADKRNGESESRRIEKAIAVTKPEVNPSCERWMSVVILRRIMRFIRSLLLPALAICDFKLEAVKVGDQQGYITSQSSCFSC